MGVKASRRMVMVVMLLLYSMVMLCLLLLLLLLGCVMVVTAAATAGVIATAAAARVLFLLYPLLEMDFGVAFLLVGSGELAAADVAGEGLLTGVGPDVGRQVVRPTERSHTDPTLERFLAGVDPDMSGEFVRSRKAPIAVLHGAGVRAFMYRSLTGAVGVLPGLNRD